MPLRLLSVASPTPAALALGQRQEAGFERVEQAGALADEKARALTGTATPEANAPREEVEADTLKVGSKVYVPRLRADAEVSYNFV